jgi:hypothetical protein
VRRGLPPTASENDGTNLSCSYEWDVAIGNTHDTNQVHLEIDAWQSEQAALSQLKSDAQSLGSLGGEISMEGDRDLYYIEKRGDAGFFYGELRVVFPQGFSLGTQVRGYHSGADEASSIRHKANQSACSRRLSARGGSGGCTVGSAPAGRASPYTSV